MGSVWSDTSALKGYEQLREDIDTDILIIGGGLAGILTAYMLRRAGADAVLVEANRVCGGITKNTTAKITSQHGLIYGKLIREFDAETAKLYLEVNEAAINRYRELCADIQCDFKETDSYIYSLRDRVKLEAEINALDKIGFASELVENLPLPFATAGAVKFPNQAQFNPLKFATAISDGLKIYENTAVREIRRHTVKTDCASINADKIVVTTHFPILNKHGSYYIKMYQHRSYVAALAGAQPVNGMYADEAQNGMSFRDYGGLLLVGGGGHRTGKTGGGHRTGKTGGGMHELEESVKRYYPGASVKYRWATQDCMTLDGVPYIGHYSASTPHLYTAAGFNKWGMTSSMVSAMILCDMLTGKKNQYERVFSPSRSVIRPQLALNAFESAINLLTPTPKRCPHMGCALKWNKYEHSWDCPCHGSRFSAEGRLIDNPANTDANI